MSGVIPPIFASSLLLFPATIAGFAGQNNDTWWGNALQTFGATLGYGQPAHLVLYAFLIIFFCFFYTALVFNARETADNLKKSGAFIRGIRPGQQTGEYIDKVLTRLTLWGALYITAVCLLPEIMVVKGGVPFQFGGTSLLIVVVVVMDFISQLIAHTQSHQYGPDEERQSAGLRPQWRAAVVRGFNYESTSLSQEDLQELQDRAPSRRGLRDLRGHAAQAAPGLTGRYRTWHV